MAHLEGLMKDLNAITTAWRPSPGHDSRTESRSLGTQLRNKELYRGWETALENTAWTHRQACASWGCFWSARKKPMSRQLPFTCQHTAGPGTMGQSFISREEARNTATLSLCGQAVSLCYDCIAFTECRHWHLCTVLRPILPSEEKHYQTEEVVVFSTSGWHLTCLNYVWKVISSVGCSRGWLVFLFFIF